MFKFFTYIDYIFKAKKGVEKPDELLSDISFGFLEIYFILSFLGLGFLGLLLGFLGFRMDSNILIIFGALFLLALFIDIVVYRKVKSFFSKMSKKTVDYTKKHYQQHSTRIIDLTENHD